jgi:hypothetical protein
MGNFGYGIAYSAKRPQQRFYDREGTTLSGMQKAKQKSDAGSDKDYEKFLDKIKAEGVHRLDQKDANDNVAKTLADIQKLREENPNGYKMKARELFNNLGSSQKEMLTRNAYLKGMEGDYDKLKQSGGLVTKAQEKAMEAIRTGNWDDLYNSRDEIGSVKFDPTSKSVAFDYAPQVDAVKLDKDMLNNPDYKTDINFKNGIAKLQDGKTVLGTYSGIPLSKQDAARIEKSTGKKVTSLEDLNEQALSNPAYLKRKTYEQYESGRLPQWQTMNDDQKMQAVKSNNLQDMKRQAGVDVNTQVVSPFKKSDKKTKGGEGFDDLLQAGVITPYEQVQIKNAQQKDVKADARYVLPFKSTTSTVVTSGKDVIDLNTNHAIGEEKQFNFLPGSIKMIKVKGEWKAYVHGQMTDTRVSDQEGSPDYKVMGDVAVPLDKVKNFLGSKPYEVPTQWVPDALDRLNHPKKKSTGSFAPPAEKKPEHYNNATEKHKKKSAGIR